VELLRRPVRRTSIRCRAEPAQRLHPSPVLQIFDLRPHASRSYNTGSVFGFPVLAARLPGSGGIDESARSQRAGARSDRGPPRVTDTEQFRRDQSGAFLLNVFCPTSSVGQVRFARRLETGMETSRVSEVEFSPA
jgi:hypothetical protein